MRPRPSSCPCRRRSFNSRTPGGVRPMTGAKHSDWLSVSIHAPREGCDLRLLPGAQTAVVVSIHAPREGCDSALDLLSYEGFVSIHAPREGCDPLLYRETMSNGEFQFTHPGRGATQRAVRNSPSFRCFNSRTPGGVRHLDISELVALRKFQFTHPGRGATHH